MPAHDKENTLGDMFGSGLRSVQAVQTLVQTHLVARPTAGFVCGSTTSENGSCLNSMQTHPALQTSNLNKEHAMFRHHHGTHSNAGVGALSAICGSYWFSPINAKHIFRQVIRMRKDPTE